MEPSFGLRGMLLWQRVLWPRGCRDLIADQQNEMLDLKGSAMFSTCDDLDMKLDH